MSRNDRSGMPLVGGSSLLVIFAVLCLTVFALLGLSTAQADRRLSEASMAAVADYYRADAQAEAILAQLRNGQCPDGVTLLDDIYTYACPISERQELQVEVRRDGARWQILRWQSVSTAAWEEEVPLEVWDGEMTFF